MAFSNYDPDSGQVYEETIMKADEMGRIRWEHQCRAQTKRLPAPFPQRGLKSLQKLCMEKIIDSANSLETETLEALPESIAINIWTSIRREWRESYHVWTAFIKAGFRAQNFKHALEIKNPGHARSPLLIDTFDKLTAPLCTWIVDLKLCNVVLSAAELKEISRVTNLGTLHIQYRSENEGRDLDNRVVQAWAARVRSDGAFAHLEQLSIANAPFITSDVFEHLSAFPVLDFYLCSGQFKSRDLRKAKSSGWCEVAGPTDAQLEGTKSPYKSAWHKRGDRYGGRLKELSEMQRQRKTSASPGAPRVDVQIGVKQSYFRNPVSTLCFERDLTIAPALPTSPQRLDGSTRPRKQRKWNDAKGADFAAMLIGG